MTISLLEFILLLFVSIGLLTGLIALLVNRKTRIGGVALLVVGGLGLFLLRLNIQQQPSSFETNQNIPTPPAIWAEGLERQFRADLYPCAEQAAYALGSDIGRWFAADDINEVCLVHKTETPKLNTLMTIVRNAIIETNTISVSTQSPQNSLHPNIPKIEVSLNDRLLETTPKHCLTAQVTRASVPSQTFTADYIDKPWLVDASTYLVLRGTTNHETVVFSTESSQTSEEASQQADQQALQQVQHRLAINRLSHGAGSLTPHDLYEHKLVKDRFVQRLHGTVGPIWREAQLLDLSPAKLKALANRLHVDQKRQHKTWLQLLISGLGLGLLVLFLYIFLNAATRGYYTWALRMAALFFVGVLVAVLLLMK